MRRGLTVIEIVLALVIIGLLAALTIPRSGRADGGDTRGELRARLALLRNAIELYYYQHGHYPGQGASDSAPVLLGDARACAPPDAENAIGALVAAQLTCYTDAQGAASATRSERFRFGPYLREGVPACPVGGARGRSAILVITGPAAPRCVSEAPAFGWVYNCDTGDIVANCDQPDASGLPFDRQ